MNEFYAQVWEEVEKIVRSEGDDTLNIDNFMRKMCLEYRMIVDKRGHQKAIKEVARINYLPEETVERVVKATDCVNGEP